MVRSGQVVEIAKAILTGPLRTCPIIFPQILKVSAPSEPHRPAQCHPGPGPALFTSSLTEPFVYSLAVGERGPVVEGWYFGLKCGSGSLVPMRCHELQERGAGSEPGTLGSWDRDGFWVTALF